MAIGDDFEIQNDKDIRVTGGSANYTVLELHRWLQSLADDASSTGDDLLDIARDTPSDKSFDTIINLINGYNIDDTLAQRLYNGSIIQASGDVIYDGIQVLAPAGMRLEIIQNGALITPNFWTTGLNADAANGISHRFLLKVRTGGADIDGRRLIGTSREFNSLYLEFKVNGTSRGVNVLAFTSWAPDLNNATAAATVATWSGVTNLVAGRNGIDVNNDAADEFFYSEWDKDAFTINEFYERIKWLTRRGTAETLYGLSGDLFRGITHQFNYDTEAGGPFTEGAEITWGSGATAGTGQLLALLDSGTTGTMWIQLKTGVIPVDPMTISQTGGKTCEINGAVTERTVSTPICGQSTGSAIIGAFGFGIQAADLSQNDKVFDLAGTLFQPPNFVTFTVAGLVDGEDSVMVGPLGYRFSYDAEAGGPFVVGETLTFTSPAGTAVVASVLDFGTTGEITIGPMVTGSVPADNSTITGGTSGATANVNGAVSNSINTRQLTLNGALSGAAVTSVVVNGAIPADTPNTGTIRILRANGARTKHAYSAWSGSTFTIASADFSSNNAANGAGVYISYIDAVVSGASFLSFTGVYAADRALFVRVRDGGVTPIKTFESPATLTSSGGSATAVRTSDA